MPAEKIINYRVELFLEEHAEIEENLNNFLNPSIEVPQLYRLWRQYLSGQIVNFSLAEYESLIKELEMIEREYTLENYIFSFYFSLLEAK